MRNSNSVFQFERFRLDAAEHRLTRDDVVISLTPKAFDTLLALVRRQGRVASKDELMCEIWPEGFVEEVNLAANISIIRKALAAADGGSTTTYIETIPKVGYRFVLPVMSLPTVASRVTRRNNLPVHLTQFVGRERELTELARFVEEKRLVTLVGPAGMGKTRLALEVARRLAQTELYADGIWLAELASLAHGSLVPETIAAAIGLTDPNASSVVDAMRESIGAKSMLLILDNCEHLIEACATVSQTLLRACSNLHIVATSREALRVSGELLWQVPPLSTPADSITGKPAHPNTFDAVRLFVQHAELAQPGLVLSESDFETIALICQKLDGMPLAIEMAAAQIAYLGVSGVAARLTDRFALLSSGDRAAARHQQTLRATLDWSYNLLSAEEQQVLEDLSVFAGGCTEAAARSVAGADEGVLLQLVRKSLVMSIPSRGDAQPRYRLLQSIQAYALAKLQARGASQATYRRHLAHYLALVQEPVEFAGPRVDAWILRITPEFDNIRAAFAHALIQPDGGGAAMRIANGMTIYSFNCGYGLEIAAWAEQAWMHDVRPSEYECAIGALAMAYRCILMLSQREEAMKFCELALPVLQDAGDLVNTMFCLEMLANNVGDQRAQNYAERLLPLAIQHQSHDMESRAYRALGFAAQMRGETSVAAMCFEKAIKRAPWDATVCYALLYKVDPAHAVRLCEQAFDRVGHDSQPRYVAAMLEAFGYMLADMGEWASAHRMFERYVRSMQLDRAGSGMDLAVMNQSVPVDLTLISGLELLTFDTGIAIMTMGILEQIAGRFDSALVRYNQAQMLSRHTGFQWACDFCELLKIGVSKNSHAVGALSQTQDCLFTVSQAGTDLYTVPALMQVAIELGLRGDLEHACLLGGAADAAAKTTTNVCSCFLVAPILWSKHAQQPKIAKMRQQALTLLGTEAYGEICARGAQMDLPQAVAIALKAR